jgi:ceramide glucosyltransferase
MTIRRTLLKSMGGFGTFGDYAAEDFALGAAVRHQGLQNVIARRLVWNVSRRRSLVSFCERYRRWAVLQRTGVSLPVSLAQSLLNPWPLSVLALLFSPGPELTASSLAILACRVAIDLASAHALGLMPFGIEAALVVPLKDLILFAAWVEALFRRTIVWRGTRLKVSADGRLIRHKVRDAAWEGAR